MGAAVEELGGYTFRHANYVPLAELQVSTVYVHDLNENKNN